MNTTAEFNLISPNEIGRFSAFDWEYTGPSYLVSSHKYLSLIFWKVLDIGCSDEYGRQTRLVGSNGEIMEMSIPYPVSLKQILIDWKNEVNTLENWELLTLDELTMTQPFLDIFLVTDIVKSKGTVESFETITVTYLSGASSCFLLNNGKIIPCDVGFSNIPKSKNGEMARGDFLATKRVYLAKHNTPNNRRNLFTAINC